MVRVYESMWRLFATAAVVAVLALTAVGPVSAQSASSSYSAFICEPSTDYSFCVEGVCLFNKCNYQDPPKKTNNDWYCCY